MSTYNITGLCVKDPTMPHGGAQVRHTLLLNKLPQIHKESNVDVHSIPPITLSQTFQSTWMTDDFVHGLKTEQVHSSS
jgi:hypothetical protein